MSWLPSIGWQILLSLVAPGAVAILICLIEARGPVSRILQKATGLVPPYFNAIGMLFSLFTALLMNDVWHKDNAARESVQAEDDAVRGLLHLARTSGLEPIIISSLQAYTTSASNENPYSRANKDARVRTDRAYEALLKVVWHTQHLDNPSKSTFLAACVELRQARDRRLYLADDETAFIKWLSILVLGALTQVALALVHIGNRSAIRVSVALFSVAFTFCLVIIAVFDQPFERALSHEPGATLRHTMQGL